MGLLSMALGGLAGCARPWTNLSADQIPADLDIPMRFQANADGAQAAWPRDDWWKGFGSEQLNGLITQAMRSNFDVAAAVARIAQADAQVRAASAHLLPVLNGTASPSWRHFGLGTGAGTRVVPGNGSLDTRSYAFGLSASYQLDLWGRNLAQRQAAIQSAMFTRFDQRTVALTVVTSVANTWFIALALADRLAIAQRNVADASRALEVVRGRMAAGTATALDAANQETLVAVQRTNIPNLTNQLRQAVNGLGVLLGTPSERITAKPDTLTSLSLPVVTPGLPSALLERRPDIAAAEADLTASGYDVTVARLAFYPSVTLTGSAGFQAAALNQLINPGGFIASLAASLLAPIFDGGTMRAALDQARGRQVELLANYRKAVVQAFTDVDNALTAWRYTSEQEALQRDAVRTARRAAEIALAQMRAGTADLTAVLTAQTSSYNAEDTLAQVRLARCQALLNLYKAMGGGWVKGGGRYPGLEPGLLEGGFALPVGGNR